MAVQLLPFSKSCQREQQRLTQIDAKENAIRADLTKLDALEREQRQTEFEESRAVRSIGADILWQRWLSRARDDLNVRLAHVLALKAQHVAQVRRANGKMNVASALAAQNAKERKRARDAAHLQKVIDHCFHN